jgi:hypothetical protein
LESIEDDFQSVDITCKGMLELMLVCACQLPFELVDVASQLGGKEFGFGRRQ